MKISTLAGAATAGAGAVMALALATPAHAQEAQGTQGAAAPSDGAAVRGSKCSVWTGGCSEIQNRSHRKVRVGRDWCGSGGNGAIRKYKAPCSGKPGHNYYKWLKPGKHSYTSAYHDTDTFRIDAGYEMHVQWNKDGQEHGPVKVYGKKKYVRWVKVSNNYDIDIEAYYKP